MLARIPCLAMASVLVRPFSTWSRDAATFRLPVVASAAAASHDRLLAVGPVQPDPVSRGIHRYGKPSGERVPAGSGLDELQRLAPGTRRRNVSFDRSRIRKNRTSDHRISISSVQQSGCGSYLRRGLHIHIRCQRPQAFFAAWAVAIQLVQAAPSALPESTVSSAMA